MDSDDGFLRGGSVDPGAVEAYYDEWAGSYDDDLELWEYRAPDTAAAYVRDHAPEAKFVLDAGCGTGLTGRALRADGFGGRLHGIDLSAESLEIARRNGRYDALARGDLQRPLEFDTDAFDALVCVGVMTYVPDVEACWREFARVVRPAGVVVTTQREDLWARRSCQEIVDRLTDTGAWEPLVVTDPQPYLPESDELGDIGVRYVVSRVL